jgi:hypothetical protein
VTPSYSRIMRELGFFRECWGSRTFSEYGEKFMKHDAPLPFPNITYSFYPVYCGCCIGRVFSALRAHPPASRCRDDLTSVR